MAGRDQKWFEIMGTPLIKYSKYLYLVRVRFNRIITENGTILHEPLEPTFPQHSDHDCLMELIKEEFTNIHGIKKFKPKPLFIDKSKKINLESIKKIYTPEPPFQQGDGSA